MLRANFSRALLSCSNEHRQKRCVPGSMWPTLSIQNPQRRGRGSIPASLGKLWSTNRIQTRPSTQRAFSLPESYMVAPQTEKGLHGGGFVSHPRNEVKGLSDAMRGLLKSEAFAPRCAEPQRKERPEKESFQPSTQMIAVKHDRTPTLSSKPWVRIEQALRTRICFYREADSAQSFSTWAASHLSTHRV
jgi:hypothetical protein